VEVRGDPIAAVSKTQQDYLRLFGDGLFTLPRPASSDLTLQDEIASYRALECFPLYASSYITDPLVWWKTHCLRFPRLARLARQSLRVPATSVPSEPVFSKAG
jgi:hypothetical protein